MKYEPFDALYWSTQLGAERISMPLHRASFATTLMSPNKLPSLLLKPLKQFDRWAVRDRPPASSNCTYGALAPLHTSPLACEQSRIGQTIPISSKVL